MLEEPARPDAVLEHIERGGLNLRSKAAAVEETAN